MLADALTAPVAAFHGCSLVFHMFLFPIRHGLAATRVVAAGVRTR